MSRYVYSVVHCVPEPRTGEFVAIGAIAGDPETGDWSVRQVENEGRVRKLANAVAIEAAHGFLARVGEDIDQQLSLLEEGDGEPLGDEWLSQLFHDHRNVVQLSRPAPMVAESADAALEVVFDRLIIEPEVRSRGFTTKHRVLSQLRESYKRAHIDPRLVHSKVSLFVGSRLHAPIDFAIGNDDAVQLAQAWSFQKSSVDEISVEVKSWGYALRRVRDGEASRLLGDEDHVSVVGPDIDIEVVIAPPDTAHQQEVFEEAEQVFLDLGVTVRDLSQVDTVGQQAAGLLGAGGRIQRS
jgi:hypothetical protein